MSETAAKIIVSGLLAIKVITAPALGEPFGLDVAGGVAGLAFGQSSASLPGFSTQFRQQGRPRLSTRLYRRLRDTVQLGGLGRPDGYWFRQGKFIGVDVCFSSRKAGRAALTLLTARYGAAQADSTSAGAEYYWLGERSFIMLTLPARGAGTGGDVLLGSLAMLNELVVGTAVRARARQQLGWHPDSLGLPRRLPGR